ncbi:MAG: disulfide bond formation protein DsbA [Gammaproteobacteria bacterium]|nr:MAG: disulfide bond formation protein DsbA [Gammaproteobacteria bacterium]
MNIIQTYSYIGDARTCELQNHFSGQLEWSWHYLPVFGNVPEKIQKQWQNRGGAAGYAAHVQKVVAEFDHVKLNEACWTSVQPVSSAPAHLWLAAARLAAQAGDLPALAEEKLAWALRVAFFEEAVDIAQHAELLEVSRSLGFDTAALLNRIENGTAYATLCQDMLEARDLDIRISPTFVFNSGRQRLSGNVGYRIIEANVKELLEQPEKQHSWC